MNLTLVNLAQGVLVIDGHRFVLMGEPETNQAADAESAVAESVVAESAVAESVVAESANEPTTDEQMLAAMRALLQTRPDQVLNRLYAKEALHHAASADNLDLCKWIAAHYGLTSDDARYSQILALRRAAEMGHLNACKWLVEHFELTLGDIRDNPALSDAIANGHFDVAAFFVDLHLQRAN